MAGESRKSGLLTQIAAQIRGVIFDVDGVLTDGRIIYSDDGHELKQFHVQDGASIKLLAQNDIAIAIITGRQSSIVARRANELGIEHLQQGATDKATALAELIEHGFPSTHLCAVGDDIQDLALFNADAVTLAATVANAHPAVAEQAHFVTERQGGNGIVVELAELILRAQDKWPFA
jgi:3-deoxy-D-manno-octulosonate 8-phosphate phosphatase (KDO 8-P phosphatase)